MARAERRLQPGRQIRAQLGERYRPGAARRADGIEIAVGKFAGEGAEHGDAERVNVGRLVAGFAGEHFRRHIAERAGNVLGRKILQAGNAHHAEIDQLERSVAFEDHVVGLDVAMDDAGAVQRRRAARQLDRDVAALLQTDHRPARQPRRQQLALVKRHHRVEAGLPPGRQFDDAADPRTVDARADPRLADEGCMVGGDRRDLRFGKFQYHLAAFDLVDRAEQAAVAAVGHQHLQQKAVDRLADDRYRDQRQLHDGGADDFGRFRRRQLDHIDHHGRAVVGRAGIERGRDQRARGIFGRRALAQDVGDGLGRQDSRARRRCTTGSGRAAPPAGWRNRAALPSRRRARGTGCWNGRSRWCPRAHGRWSAAQGGRRRAGRRACRRHAAHARSARAAPAR